MCHQRLTVSCSIQCTKISRLPIPAVCANRFLESLQSGFYTACLSASTSNPSFSKVQLVPRFAPSEVLRLHQKPSLLLFPPDRENIDDPLSASNFNKKSPLFSPAPQYQRMPFHGPELATKPGKPPSNGKDLDTLREALASAGLPPLPPTPPLLLQPQVEGKWRKRRDSDRFVIRFEDGLRCLIFLLIHFQ